MAEEIRTLFTFLLLLVPAVVGQECECPASHCPDGWTTFRGSCYYVSDNISVDWTEAIHHCQQHGAELIIIDNKDEDLFIRSLLERMYRAPSQHPGQEFWIGANDQMIMGQPGSEGDEDCAVIASRSDIFNGWHDAPCAASHHPICEISASQSVDIIG